MPMLLDSETLNDYIVPATKCTIPLLRKIGSNLSDAKAVHLDESTSTYYEVSKEGGISNLNEANTISLSDCLACSGCITSSELILVQQQNYSQFLNYLESRREAIRNCRPVSEIILSVSRESLASFAARYNMSLNSVARKITWFAKRCLDCSRVLDMAVFNRMALHEVFDEFKLRLKKHNESKLSPISIPHPRCSPSTCTSSSSSSSISNCSHSISIPSSLSPLSFLSTHQPSESAASPVSSPKIRVSSNMLRHRDFSKQSLPLLCSSCPAWICYVEKEHSELVPLLSNVRSPQQVSGALVKKLWPTCYYITVMSCPDKKLEAARPDFIDPLSKSPQVDSVLTTLDLEHLLTHLEPNLSFADFPETEPLDPFFECTSTYLTASPNSSSGGYVSYIVMNAPSILQLPEEELQLEVKGTPDFAEYIIQHQGQPVLRLAGVYGFKQIQNYLRRLANDRVFYHYVEIMACPRGCANGGGQGPIGSQYSSSKEWISAIETAYYQYTSPTEHQLNTSHNPPHNDIPAYEKNKLLELYENVVGGPPGSEAALKLLRTCFHPMPQPSSSYLLEEKNPITSSVKRVLTVQDALW